MAKLKVLTVVGTRPEVIRLSRVISLLDLYCDHILVHTGQNYDYELNQIFFDDLGVREPNHYLGCAHPSGSACNTIGNVISSVEQVLLDERPDCMLVLGDTNSCLSVLPAKRLKIPTFHMEAGNRCFDERVPEEINRRIVDHTADINLTYSTIARDYLLREGIAPDRVINTGSPMLEVLEYYMPSILSSEALEKNKLEKHKYFVVSLHREENVDDEDSFRDFVNILNSVSNRYQFPIVVSTHPRTKSRFNSKDIELHPNVRLLKPLGFFDYINLQLNSLAVLSDSGTISEESSILNFPALNLRQSHERPEAMEEAAVMMVGLNLHRINQALEILVDQPRGENRLLSRVAGYNSNNVSNKIVRILHSYTDYVNRVVWRKGV